MKSIVFVLIIVGFLPAEYAYADTWVKIVESKTSKIYVDTDSIKKTGNIVAAWYRRDFNQAMTTEKFQRPYKSSKVLNYYNCSDNEMAAAQWIRYEKSGGLGKVILNEKVISLSYEDIPIGETGKAVFDFVCKYSTRHKN